MNYFSEEKHYNTLNNYYRNRFGSKVYKIALNGDFTCPNRDGTISSSGCIFCSDKGSGEFGGNRQNSLKDQFINLKSMMENKWKEGKYIVYFQSFSNTYGPIKKLRKLYYEALSLDKDIVGLNIGTRADCFNDEIYDLLEEINEKTYLTIELGLQSMHDKTLKTINRGHDLMTFIEAVKNLRKRNIDVVVHIINGLPGEDNEMMIKTAKFLNTLDIQGIKIHMLYIIENTPLARIFAKKPFPMLTMKEYVEITVKQLTFLDPKIIIHRVTGDPERSALVEPAWALKKFIVSNEIDKLMRKNNLYQGINYNHE
ncbi:MAG: TIGR01212 family radical SAM protein [Candidatus Izemoplasmatales bacterium]|jgi:radical SAM protein (TIGR01212 family)|nr:TIGR01212 family radical SAM protein [Candidatus Izemoplasmatales bacterium]